MVCSRFPESDGAKMEYWNTAISEKSFEVLQKIKKEINFILIGGWAAYLWAKSHKSKDIDIVVDYKELDKLKLNYNLRKNDNLRKYEIKIEEIDIDIYVPFYSELPLLENLKDYTTKIEGFRVIRPESLIVLKQAAELSRSGTEKGLKDRIDIIDLLLKCQINFGEYSKIVEKERLIGFKKRLLDVINKFNEVKYLGLNPRQFKLKKEELVTNIKKTS
ncbi:hypothetical protein J4448_02015 [Candidatus Woesearchaeota archaeon]|nr:hypothetical protein [Candidatus Woesearchaeota archaeon]